MQLAPSTAQRYAQHAFDQMIDVAERLGDELVNRQPLGPQTNSVTGLIVHCCGVSEFWLGHVALGRPSARDRSAEFTTTATVAELRALIERTAAQLVADVDRLEAGEGVDEGGRQFLLDGDGSDAAVIIHVLEELYQHLGHMELAAAALLGERTPSDYQ